MKGLVGCVMAGNVMSGSTSRDYLLSGWKHFALSDATPASLLSGITEIAPLLANIET